MKITVTTDRSEVYHLKMPLSEREWREIEKLVTDGCKLIIKQDNGSLLDGQLDENLD